MSNKIIKIFKGTSWIFFITWYTRILGMISFFILARHLDKTDFGILAGCFVVQGFFAILADFGTGHYLIKKKEITKEDLDVAWTLNITTRTMIAILVYVLSDIIAKFLHIVELSYVLKLLSLSPFFIGLHNPAINLKIKKLDYAAISYLQSITKTISTTLTLFIAIKYKTYFAVIIAEVVYQFIYAIGSYIIVSYQPRFAFKKIYKQWNFSKWILIKNFVAYIKYTCDNIIVSRNFALSDLGIYNFSKESSSTVVGFIISPVISICYTSLADYADNKSELINRFYKFFMIISCIYTPIVFGGVYLAEELVPIIFGEKWADSSYLFSLFLIMTYARCFNQILADIFILIDEVKKHFIYELITSIIIILVMVGLSSLPLELFAASRVIVAYLVFISMTIFLSTMIKVSIFTLLKLSILPIFASVSMLMFISFVNIGLTDVLNLFVSIVLGGAFYLIISIITLKFLRNKYSFYSYLYDSVLVKISKTLQSKLKHRIYGFSKNH